MANIFDAVGEGLDAIQKDLAQEARNNRIQAESLAATSIYNDFETTVSKDFLEQQANYDGSYDLEKTNEEKFRLLQEDTLNQIDNDNVRNTVSKQILNYKSRYEIHNKATALGLEKDIQTKELDKQLSFKISKIHANPDDYASVLSDLDVESQSWRQDYKRDYYDKYASALSENYIIAKVNDLQNKRLNNTLSQSEYIEARKLLRNFILSSTTPLTASSRETYIKSFDQQEISMLEKVNSAAKKVADGNFSQLIEANNNNNLEIPMGVSKLDYLNQQAELAYSDDPVKLLEAKVSIETSEILSKATKALSFGDTEEANTLLSLVSVQQNKYQAAGDIYRTNAYVATAEKIREKIAATEKARESNLSNFLEQNNDPSFAMLTFEQSTQPQGKRDYSNRSLYVYQSSLMSGVPSKGLKFMTDTEDKNYRNQLHNLLQSGDYEAFQLFSKNFAHDWGSTLAGDHDVLSSAIDQLTFIKKDEQGNVVEQPPLLAFAMKYAAADSKDGEDLFKLLSVPEDQVKTTDLKQGEFNTAIESQLKDYVKAFSNYPDLLSNNPIETYRQFLYHASRRASNVSIGFLQGKSEKDIVKALAEKTINKDYKLVHNPILGSKIPIPAAKHTKNIQMFIGDRVIFKNFLQDVKNENLPIPTEMLIDSGVKRNNENIDINDAQFTGVDFHNPFSTDKEGNLNSVTLEGRGGKLQFKQLLNTGVFLPTGDGSAYRLYAYFPGEKKRHALIFGRKGLDGKPVYFDVPGQDIDRTYAPLYRQRIQSLKLDETIREGTKGVIFGTPWI